MNNANPNDAKCYACDADATGQTDHNGERKAACVRHADPKLPRLDACVYCGDNVRSGAVFLNMPDSLQNYAHQKCYRADCAS